RNSVPMSSALLRTAVVKGLRFREDLNTPEIELFLRLAQGGGRFAFCPDFLCEYRVHPGSATSAGLLGERLAERLLSLPSNPAAEPWRTRFLSALLADSVGRCLLSGNHAEARKFIEHREYRAGSRKAVMAVQRLCAALPSASGVPLYRCLHRLKSSG
ncbi:MAG TPA: hypothetical protein VK968_18835, partial [Roseimicrobium sp.]|nr:hypothetical protein [Roseimicrobium sp.]